MTTTGNPFIDGLMAQVHNDTDARLRALGAMPLGQLVAELRQLPEGTVVTGVSPEVNSYRGYYEDLAIEPGLATSATTLVEVLSAAIGQTFEGYKGGDFTMDRMTRVWVAPYGDTSDALIVGVAVNDGVATLQTVAEEW